MLNDALRVVRAFHDLNKSETAERVGLSKSYVTELESGDKKVTLEVLQKYAEAFNIPLSSLMFFAESLDSEKPERIRTAVASKVLRMLKWIAVKAEAPDKEDD